MPRVSRLDEDDAAEVDEIDDGAGGQARGAQHREEEADGHEDRRDRRAVACEPVPARGQDRVVDVSQQDPGDRSSRTPA